MISKIWNSETRLLQITESSDFTSVKPLIFLVNDYNHNKHHNVCDYNCLLWSNRGSWSRAHHESVAVRFACLCCPLLLAVSPARPALMKGSLSPSAGLRFFKQTLILVILKACFYKKASESSARVETVSHWTWQPWLYDYIVIRGLFRVYNHAHMPLAQENSVLIHEPERRWC